MKTNHIWWPDLVHWWLVYDFCKTLARPSVHLGMWQGLVKLSFIDTGWRPVYSGYSESTWRLDEQCSWGFSLSRFDLRLTSKILGLQSNIHIKVVETKHIWEEPSYISFFPYKKTRGERIVIAGKEKWLRKGNEHHCSWQQSEIPCRLETEQNHFIANYFWASNLGC